MRWSTEEKQSLVARYQAGESVAEICADTGIARSTFYTWIKPYTTTTTDSGYVVSQQEFIKMKQRIQKRSVGCSEWTRLSNLFPNPDSLMTTLSWSPFSHLWRRKKSIAHSTNLSSNLWKVSLLTSNSTIPKGHTAHLITKPQINLRPSMRAKRNRRLI